MESRICCWLVLALQVLSLATATSRTFAPNDDVGVHQPVTGQSQESAAAPLDSTFNKISTLQHGGKSMEGVTRIGDEAFSKSMSRLGSSPPSCDQKCYGCTPCEAIQVPTTSSKKHTRLGLDYANYEPMGWKCKCGPSFYSP